MTEVASVMAKPIAQALLRDEPLLRLSYTALDGAPRVIPVGNLWNGRSFQLWMIPHSAKVRALDFETTAPSAVEQLVRARGQVH